MDMRSHEMTVEEEIADTSAGRPHVLLLGAGASHAALPKGDKYGRPVPLLRDVAKSLNLVDFFPEQFKDLSVENFEQAYSRLFQDGPGPELSQINGKVHGYFSQLELPDEPNLYDIINLSLREKDIILTFNWDPFLMLSRIRLAQHGLGMSLPKPYFLHGNVTVGFCEHDQTSGVVGNKCSRCGKSFTPSNLLYPVENKDYQTDAFIRREWDAAKYFLEGCLMFTVFGYSAPTTDKEAIELLKNGWGEVQARNLEQTEIINRPGADHQKLSGTWSPFIHTHHYNIRESFFDSWIAQHPRRSIEAYWNQYLEAKFITANPVPTEFSDFNEMDAWFRPLIMAELKKKSSEA